MQKNELSKINDYSFKLKIEISLKNIIKLLLE